MSKILILYLLAVNVIAFLCYGVDKVKARKGMWRTPESTLLLLALMGGSVGAWTGMKFWRHKTQHKKFKYGIPLILLLQLGHCLVMVDWMCPHSEHSYLWAFLGVALVYHTPYCLLSLFLSFFMLLPT